MTDKTMSKARFTSSNPVTDWFASGRIIAYNVRFAEITGSHSTGLFLAQLWFWSGTPSTIERNGWFWLTQAEISDQMHFTRTETETCRRRLRQLGILEEKKEGIPSRLWYRLDKERFFALCSEYLQKQSEEDF